MDSEYEYSYSDEVQSYSDDFEDEDDPANSGRSTTTGDLAGDPTSPPREPVSDWALPPALASRLLDRIRRRSEDYYDEDYDDDVVGQEETSVTYAALLPNIESWSGGEGHASVGRVCAREGHDDGVVVARKHLLDRLAIESLTLSMRNYRAEEGNDLLVPKADVACGLRRMLGVVERKLSERLPDEAIEALYDPILLVGRLARFLARGTPVV
ncbi:hypothetical protein HOP50_02g16980 [Chloropicon primus]|uniref:Uncharacterized protein n=2 Tax=Chloropicon primus TaxID=1764295 RepID=A0A5B8MGB8_9CHLO|nr:hypothetical protein A3770_02p17020 [Chloropicon primus]UPQ98392.1 hypothetical protein HOP50_02g16980 [Chloropicon primus]|eukprot:QDZ19184.1 hypothetical protein A3770_02p17020 [Chloropicon primus]